MMKNKRALHMSLAVLWTFIGLAIIFPNSFGNNPDLIQDESYFLTSSLSAIEKHTLPGWEFSTSGAYYGGVQAYIDTATLVPAIGYQLLLSNLSLTRTKIWVATHTGDLLHLLRVINGIIVAGSVGFLFYYLSKRNIPRPLALRLLLILFLVLGNSVVVGLLHTAKVWTLYMLIDICLGVLFLLNEYYLAHRNEPFIPKNRYLAFLVWGAVLAFSQNFIGIFSAGLWILYALLLKHFTPRELAGYALSYWYWFILFAITQFSFIYRGFFLRSHPSLLDLADTSSRSPGNEVQWLPRLYDPLINAFLSQPLILLYLAGIAILIVCALYNRSLFGETRKRIYIAIALAHPLLVFGFFHAVLGFSLFPRYSLMIAIACSFSAAILLGESRRALIAALVVSALLFGAVNARAIELFWTDSSAVRLTNILESQYNDSNNVFIIEPSAGRLSLPVTQESLSLLNERRKNISRFQFLMQNASKISGQVSFKPTVIFADTNEEMALAVRALGVGTTSIWTISQDCNRVCSVEESSSNACFSVNISACGILSKEDQKEYPVLTLYKFLRQSELGITYTVHKIR